MPEKIEEKLQSSIALVLVRMHNAEEVDIYALDSVDDIRKAIHRLGRDELIPFEFYMSYEDTKLNSAQSCIESNDPESAIIILSSYIEYEINTLIRILLRIRNFSGRKITNTLKGIDIRTKADVILPLCDVHLSDIQKQIISEINKTRNQIVHFKATPWTESNACSSEGDMEKVKAKSEQFFDNFSVELIREHFLKLTDESLSNDKDCIKARQLVCQIWQPNNIGIVE